MAAGKKHIWTNEELQLLKDNYATMNSYQLANFLGITRTLVRMKCYELNLYRMRLQHWTVEQVQYLKDNYKQIGDTEIAAHFSATYPKEKGWSKKHIEKKRRYLNLKRTPAEIKNIRIDWTEKGLYKESNRKMWQTRGVTPIGEIRVWKSNTGHKFKVIKTATGFVHYARYLWQQHNGPIPKNKMIRVKDNSLNVVIENLDCIDLAENQLRNTAIRCKIPVEYIRTSTIINKLKTKIKQHGTANI